NKSAATRLNPDYSRVGPDLHGNSFVRRRSDGVVITNSLNGIFIRSSTPAGGQLEEMTVPGRFDDIDITHIVAENLIVSGTPGGPTRENIPPSSALVIATLQSQSTGKVGQFTTA